jgi:hypothetical protein
MTEVRQLQSIGVALTPVLARPSRNDHCLRGLQFRALFGQPESWAKLPYAQRRDRANSGPQRGCN